MSGLSLDLSGATESKFDALPAAWYRGVIFDVEQKATKGGPTAKLPVGTPMLNVQFKITEGEFENRRVFRSYVIAPDKIDKKPYEHKATMDGILYSFLKAAGFDPDEIKSGNFTLDFDEMKGRSVRVKLAQVAKKDSSGSVVTDENGNPEMANEVKDVKADNGEAVAGGDDLGLLS